MPTCFDRLCKRSKQLGLPRLPSEVSLEAVLGISSQLLVVTLPVALLALLQFVVKYEFFFSFDKQIAFRRSYWTAHTKVTMLKERI